MADAKKLTIDIYSDVMCPWCIIGYSQLQKGLAQLGGEIEAEVRWLPFELNPDITQVRNRMLAAGELKRDTYFAAADFNRAVELGFPMRKAKGEVYFHWNSSRELKAYQFVLEHDPELADEDDDYPDDAA